jgi:hypothetical protein
MILLLTFATSAPDHSSACTQGHHIGYVIFYSFLMEKELQTPNIREWVIIIVYCTSFSVRCVMKLRSSLRVNGGK